MLGIGLANKFWIFFHLGVWNLQWFWLLILNWLYYKFTPKTAKWKCLFVWSVVNLVYHYELVWVDIRIWGFCLHLADCFPTLLIVVWWPFFFVLVFVLCEDYGKASIIISIVYYLVYHVWWMKFLDLKNPWLPNYLSVRVFAS